MDLTKTIHRNKNCAYQVAEGKAVIMLADNSNIFTLNEIGTEIWNLLETPKTIDNIIKGLLLIYGDDENETIKNDVLEFLNTCFNNKIVHSD